MTVDFEPETPRRGGASRPGAPGPMRSEAASPFGRGRPAGAPTAGRASGSLRPAGREPDPGAQRRWRRVAVALAVAGLVLAACWVTVTGAIQASRSSREEARQLATIAAQADTLVDLRTLLGPDSTPAAFARTGGILEKKMATLERALAQLPRTTRIDRLRQATARVEPLTASAFAAIRRGDVAGADRIDRGQLAPTLRELRAQSRDISAAQLRRAARVEDVARVASGLALFGGAGVLGLIGIGFSRLRQRGIVERTRAEVELVSGKRLEALISHATGAVTVLDREGRITWMPSSPAVPLARSPEAAIGSYFTDLVHPSDRGRGSSAFADLLATPEDVTTTQLRLATGDGGQRPVEIRGENRLADPAIGGVILTIHDVSERALLEDQLERLASSDPVTGVANRAQLEAHLQNAVDRRDRAGALAGLLLVDLHDFRAVADTLGHEASDELLRHAARRLEHAAGESDLVARLDGDTFAVLLDDLRGVGDGQARASLVLASLRGRAAVSGGHAVELDAHAGLAFGAVDVPAREIIRHADLALLEAKAAGSAQVVSFTDRMREKVTERVALTGDLRRATERDEFEVDYQPIVDLSTGRLVAVEALARWTHPKRGRLSPDTFVDLAEQTGLIRPLGELVLRQACREVAGLLAGRADALDYVSVNISPRQLEDPDIGDVVRSALHDADLAPHRLMLELTERSIATDPERLIERLVELRGLGIRIALDDFGAGYSFLSYLESYPLDALKIDRSLARSLGDRADSALLLKGIVELSGASGMSVIVEGVERATQREKAREIGIPLGQGFLFARPGRLADLDLG